MAIAVTWIQGVLRVATGSSGSPRVSVDMNAAWSREQFPEALAEALAKAGAPRGEVFLGTDSPLVLPLVEEIPPASPAIAAKLLQKRAEKAAVFAEPVYVGATAIPGVVGVGLRRYLLQVAPAAWVQAIDKALEPRGYQLAGLFPAALALQPVLARLSAPKEEAVLLAAEAETGLLQVVGRPDGAILFYRTLPMAQGRGADEALREVRRLALYAEQRLGLKLRRVLVSGEMAEPLLHAAQGAEDLTVGPAPATGSQVYFRFLFGARAKQPDNVVPPSIAMRSRRRRWKVLAGTSAVGLLAGAVLWTSGRLVERELKAAEIRKIWQRQEQLAAEADREREGLVKFGRELEVARVLREEAAWPAPELVLRSLPDLLPPELELTRFRAELDPQKSAGTTAVPVYRVELVGRTVREDVPVAAPVQQLAERMEKSEWKMKILVATGRETPGAAVPAEFRGPGRFYLSAEVQ